MVNLNTPRCTRQGPLTELDLDEAQRRREQRRRAADQHPTACGLLVGAVAGLALWLAVALVLLLLKGQP